MNITPLLQFLEDAAGSRWTVLFAGPVSPEVLPGLRHVVFMAAGERIVAEHDWIAEPLSEPELRLLLERSRGAGP